MTRGVYLEPAAVARDPDYAAALVDAGVTIFLLRTGFNPRRAAPQLEDAVRVAQRVGAAVWLLAGTWWGHGVSAGADAMALPDAWRRLDRQGLLGDYPAHEAQWPMWAPGGSADAAIAANLEQLAGWNPAAICLTHARFRHPAAIGGLFETGPAWTDALQPAHWQRVVAGMRASTPGQLAEFAERAGGRALIDALDRFAQLGDRDGGGGPDAPYADWFARRRTRVRRAESRFLAAARGSGGPALLAGGNAIAPHAAVLSGQHYGELAAHADFVQPLLGYMEWHVFQCGAAWARLLRRCIRGLSEAAALESVWRLFGLHAHSLPLRETLLAGEGDGATIERVVTALLRRALEECPAQRLMPVLRGHDWPPEVTLRLEERVRAAGCPALFYQGTSVLAGPPPGPGWQ